MHLNFSGKLALVTASSRGIGFSIASNLHAMGALVAMCGRDNDALQASVQKIDVNGERAFAMAGDIGSLEFLQSLVAAVTERFSQTIDILINNNGGPPAGSAMSRTEQQWREAIDRNFMSTVRLCQLVVPGMQSKHWGRIINLTSLSGKEPDPGMVLSSVTRVAVAAYGKTLSRELGPDGITVNTIMTGGVLTDRALGFIREEAAANGETLEAAIVRVGKTLPVQHIASPDEFAQTILFLASEEASYVTGVALCLDGGASHSVF
jgi:3-oxoacyl-[acyl-carrier protein] reductase